RLAVLRGRVAEAEAVERRDAPGPGSVVVRVRVGGRREVLAVPGAAGDERLVGGGRVVRLGGAAGGDRQEDEGGGEVFDVHDEVLVAGGNEGGGASSSAARFIPLTRGPDLRPTERRK